MIFSYDCTLLTVARLEHRSINVTLERQRILNYASRVMLDGLCFTCLSDIVVSKQFVLLRRKLQDFGKINENAIQQ